MAARREGQVVRKEKGTSSSSLGSTKRKSTLGTITKGYYMRSSPGYLLSQFKEGA